MMSIMKNRHSSSQVVELAADVIAAHARFNGRIGTAKRAGDSGSWILQAMDFAERIYQESGQLEHKFSNGLDRAEVCDALLVIRKELDQFVIPENTPSEGQSGAHGKTRRPWVKT
jgi:hypothetical protein